MKFLVLVLGIVICILILKYTEPIVRTFGKNSLAERYLGAGGTYNMWKLIGLAVAVLAFLYSIGVIDVESGWNDETLNKLGNKNYIEITGKKA